MDEHHSTSDEIETVTIPETPWTHPADSILDMLDVDPITGLTDHEATQRQSRFGKNVLKSARKIGMSEILARQLKSMMVILLMVAAGISFVVGKMLEAEAIFAVIVINTGIGFYTEWRAIRSMEALYELTTVITTVRRNGETEQIPAEKVVPGDIVILEAGDVVTADLRLIKTSKLQVNESALTGESIPVDKNTEAPGDVGLAERACMMYKGTALTRGSGEGVVVATGMDTELGKISALIDEEIEEENPLEKRLEALGQKLVWVTVGIAVLVAASGIITGKAIILMVETAIALAVATVPEGLPMVATLSLARGMWQMAKRNALINRLSAVETLGSTSVICTDKTGTLTENLMTVVRIVTENEEVAVTGTGLQTEGDFLINGRKVDPSAYETLKKILVSGLLCNNATLNQSKAYGDPTEVALLVAGRKGGLVSDDLTNIHPEVREISFDPSLKMMATMHRGDYGFILVTVKGAPESVLQSCSAVLTDTRTIPLTKREQEKFLEKSEKMGENGLRVLALAQKEISSLEEDPYTALVFLGLVGLLDPPRKEVRPSIAACQKAGVRVVMVTGDHAATARNVAQSLGLANADTVLEGQEMETATQEELLSRSIFARVTPAQKLTLIDTYQKAGIIVAMTGDGVNDAPALKKADIGVAMGKRGTQVAREAADMILEDDNFTTIVNAIEQGRIIFENIRKFVFYLLSCNISEILVVFLASFLGIPLPLLPLQILFLNVVTDIFPAFALGGGKGSSGIMNRPPRDSQEPVLTQNHWIKITLYSVIITCSVLGAFGIAYFHLTMEVERAITISFLTLGFSQLWHVFNMRDKWSPFLVNEITTNTYVWGALGLCTGLLLAATYVEGLSLILQTTSPGALGWVLIIILSLIPWGAGQIWHSLSKQ
jgi:Ca2+-transporting ATPase